MTDIAIFMLFIILFSCCLFH